MKKQISTPAAQVKQLAKEIIEHVNVYQHAEKQAYIARSTREWDEAQSAKAGAATDMFVALQMMLSEMGCVLSSEGIIGMREYYSLEKKNF